MQFYNANMNYKKKLDSLKPSIYVFKLVLKKYHKEFADKYTTTSLKLNKNYHISQS